MRLQNVFIFAILSFVKSDILDNKVVGGEDARYQEYPHQISLQWNYDDGTDRRFHFCGGSVLNENWVLTAGHCILSYGSKGYIEVAAGEHELSKPHADVQRRRVAKAYVHERYGGGVGPYDIALIKLKEPLELGAGVQSVKLPPRNEIPRGAAELSGWGSTSNTSRPSYPSTLKKAFLPIINLQECRRMWPEQPVHIGNVCAGDLDGSKSACSGDSGGPLIQRNAENGEVVEIGVVSWGHIPCGKPQRPGVFTRVSYFVDWINEHLEKCMDE